MKIVFLTSKDHIYANYILKRLLENDIFNNDIIFVFEQDWVVPHKSKIKGILKYVFISGWYYTALQIVKQFLFLVCRYAAFLKNLKNSIFFPYYLNKANNFKREVFIKLKSLEQINHIQSVKPDLIISIFSKEIVPEDILKVPKYGCINLHPSLIPFYKGVSPTFWCLSNKEKKTGITLHYLDKNIDTGEIISQKEFSTDNFKTEHSLYVRCSELGVDLVLDYLKKVKNNINVSVVANVEKGTYYSIPTKKAVKKFKKNGFSFFKLSEFLKALTCSKTDKQ